MVDPYLEGHVNPYHVGGDFGVTSGMLGVEIARLVHPSVEPLVRHIAAVSAVGDRSEAPERGRFLALAAENYTEEHCKEIALALDYLQFWLRFNDGRELVKDLLNLNGNEDRHRALVRHLVDQANLAIAEQVEASMPHVKSRTLTNGVHLFLLDVESPCPQVHLPPAGQDLRRGP